MAQLISGSYLPLNQMTGATDHLLLKVDVFPINEPKLGLASTLLYLEPIVWAIIDEFFACHCAKFPIVTPLLPLIH